MGIRYWVFQSIILGASGIVTVPPLSPPATLTLLFAFPFGSFCAASAASSDRDALKHISPNHMDQASKCSSEALRKTSLLQLPLRPLSWACLTVAMRNDLGKASPLHLQPWPAWTGAEGKSTHPHKHWGSSIDVLLDTYLSTATHGHKSPDRLQAVPPSPMMMAKLGGPVRAVLIDALTTQDRQPLLSHSAARRALPGPEGIWTLAVTIQDHALSPKLSSISKQVVLSSSCWKHSTLITEYVLGQREHPSLAY